MLESDESDSCNLTSLMPFTADLVASYQGNNTQSCFLVVPLGSLNYYDRGKCKATIITSKYAFTLVSGVCIIPYLGHTYVMYKQFRHFHLGESGGALSGKCNSKTQNIHYFHDRFVD